MLMGDMNGYEPYYQQIFCINLTTISKYFEVQYTFINTTLCGYEESHIPTTLSIQYKLNLFNSDWGFEMAPW